MRGLGHISPVIKSDSPADWIGDKWCSIVDFIMRYVIC